MSSIKYGKRSVRCRGVYRRARGAYEGFQVARKAMKQLLELVLVHLRVRTPAAALRVMLGSPHAKMREHHP